MKSSISIAVVLVAQLSTTAESYVTTSPPSSTRTTSFVQTSSTTRLMFKDASTPASTAASATTTELGNLVVPTVGIGTISWSSNSLTTLENLELQSVMNEACKSDAAFFDTAERYGSHMKTALGLGYGETELLLQKLQKNCPYLLDGSYSGGDDEGASSKRPIVATKFTPTPWRTTVDSVVAACEQSRQRLGVDQIDLYQLHMPDIVQPLRFLGLGKSKDEIYWKGLAECHRLGLVKNVGVSNYGPTLVSQMNFLSEASFFCT